MAREKLTQDDVLKQALAWIVLGAVMIIVLYAIISIPNPVAEWAAIAAVAVVLGSIGFSTSHTNDDTDEAGNPNELE